MNYCIPKVLSFQVKWPLGIISKNMPFMGKKVLIGHDNDKKIILHSVDYSRTEFDFFKLNINGLFNLKLKFTLTLYLPDRYMLFHMRPIFLVLCIMCLYVCECLLHSTFILYFSLHVIHFAKRN